MPPPSISSTTPVILIIQAVQSPSSVLSSASPGCQHEDATLLLQSAYILSSQQSIRLFVGLTVGLTIGSVVLVLTFAMIQSQADDLTRDAEWPQLLSSGKFTASVERLFVLPGRAAHSEEAKDVEMMKTVLLAIVTNGVEQT